MVHVEWHTSSCVLQHRLLQTRNSVVLLKKIWNSTTVLLFRQTNICGVTLRLFIGIIQGRCSCCLLDNNFRIFCRSLFVFAGFNSMMSAFFKHYLTTCKLTSLLVECCRCWTAWLTEWPRNTFISRLPANSTLMKKSDVIASCFRW